MHNQLDWAFGILFLLAIIFLVVVYWEAPTAANALLWSAIILVIILIIYIVGHYQHRQGWKVFGFLALVIYLLIVVLPGVGLVWAQPVMSSVKSSKKQSKAE